MVVDRQQSWDLLCRYTKGEGLRKHALSVEAAMGAYAQKYGEDVATWKTVGLLHDFDYEQFPSEHPQKGEPILEAEGYPDEIRRAILAHSDHTGVVASTKMEKTLRAVDELCGLVIAVALIKPDKCLASVDLRSVKKKWKDKAFARGVDRSAIQEAVVVLGEDLEAHIKLVIEALQDISDQLGL